MGRRVSALGLALLLLPYLVHSLPPLEPLHLLPSLDHLPVTLLDHETPRLCRRGGLCSTEPKPPSAPPARDPLPTATQPAQTDEGPSSAPWKTNRDETVIDFRNYGKPVLHRTSQAEKTRSKPATRTRRKKAARPDGKGKQLENIAEEDEDEREIVEVGEEKVEE